MIALCCSYFGQLEKLPEATSLGHPLQVLDAFTASPGAGDGAFEVEELQPLITVCIERFWRDPSVAFWLAENGQTAKLFLHFTQSIVYADQVDDETIGNLLRRFDLKFASSVDTVELVRMLWRGTDAGRGECFQYVR